MSTLTHDQMTDLDDLIAKRVGDAVSASATPRKWLTLEEAKKYGRVKSKATIMAWITAGYIYAFRRSGAWVIDRESIDEWYGSERGY